MEEHERLSRNLFNNRSLENVKKHLLLSGNSLYKYLYECLHIFRMVILHKAGRRIEIITLKYIEMGEHPC